MGGWFFVGLSGKSSESRTFEQKRLERDKKKMDVSIWVSIPGKLGERKEVLARRKIAK